MNSKSEDSPRRHCRHRPEKELRGVEGRSRPCVTRRGMGASGSLGSLGSLGALLMADETPTGDPDPERNPVIRDYYIVMPTTTPPPADPIHRQ
jgi:hypothetical protein